MKFTNYTRVFYFVSICIFVFSHRRRSRIGTRIMERLLPPPLPVVLDLDFILFSGADESTIHIFEFEDLTNEEVAVPPSHLRVRDVDHVLVDVKVDLGRRLQLSFETRRAA